MTDKMLSDAVRVARRFRRSVRVDADMDTEALEGFVCPGSAAIAMLGMATQFVETGQGAFTWTGPYGCGKSSLALAFAALLGRPDLRKHARDGLGVDLSARLEEMMRPDGRNWQVVPVVGRRSDPSQVICDALIKAANSLGQPAKKRPMAKDPAAVLDAVIEAATKAETSVLLIIDEMGKFLEHAAGGGGDAYFFQLLAEASARSGGRLLVIGVLHQAFDDYAHRLAREARDEWLKIQGRYADIPINVAGEEQIELIARAIETESRPRKHSAMAHRLAALVAQNRSTVETELSGTLDRCWPLHPATACLLGPISRRRFGQNQRSIFGFLNSAEPFGFRDFLTSTPEATGKLYDLVQLWSYLRANLEPSILASPDGHRWSLAVEAISRCEAKGGDQAHLDTVKAIALIDLFKERSGLAASEEALAASLPHIRPKDLKAALADLSNWSVVIYRKYAGAFALFAGSDFDIERAVAEARGRAAVDLGRVRELAVLQPVLAKRHYHVTGAMRWFDLDICAVGDAVERAREFAPTGGAAGLFLLLVAVNSEKTEAIRKIAEKAMAAAGSHPVVVGIVRESYTIREHTAELIALETIRSDQPELRGDAVARREVLARISSLSSELQEQVRQALTTADWRWRASDAARDAGRAVKGPARLSHLASALADNLFPASPRIRNELLNRAKPSSNAVGAQRALMNAMISRPNENRLGIEGWPAEAGLYASILERTGLHAADENGQSARFVDPTTHSEGEFASLWAKADEVFQGSGATGATMQVLYDEWRKARFGVRDGLLPILATAFYLSRSSGFSLYLDGVFSPQLTSMYVDRLLQDPGAVRLRWSEFSQLHRSILVGIAGTVAELSPRGAELDAAEPFSVARGLVAGIVGTHPWTLRTTSLSSKAERVRNLAKNASDPNKLLLDDLPQAFGGQGRTESDRANAIVAAVTEGLREINGAYDEMLADLKGTLLRELRVLPPDEAGIEALQARAKTVRGLTGDFRLDAFAVSLSHFFGERQDVEAIASLAANRPPRDWVDRDVDRARAEIVVLSQQFIRAEAIAHVKGREGRISMAIVIGDPSRPGPVMPTFDVPAKDMPRVREIAASLLALMDDRGTMRELALAAIAEAGAQLATRIGEGEVTLPTRDESRPRKRKCA